MVKGVDVTEHWTIWDMIRNPYNPNISQLFANLSSSELNGVTQRNPEVSVDILSN
jgi:hypothetical protein